MSNPRVAAFRPNRINEGKTQGPENHGREEGSQVDVQAAVLPGIYRDDQRGGSGGGQSDNDNQQLVQFLRGANTQELKTLASNVEAKPLFSIDSPLAYLGPNAIPAAYSPKSRAEENRRHWGDFMPGGSSRAKYLPLDGMDISFDPNDRAINATVPRQVLAHNTTVPESMDFQVRGGLYEANMNVGNPRKDRLQVYNLAGVNLRA